MNQTESTILGKQAFIKGELHLDGPAVIAGRVEGAVSAQDTLEIAAEGSIEGDIQGVVVDIHGTIRGNVVASRACRLSNTARVTGELRAANLSIAEGASFHGQVFVGEATEPEMPDDPAEDISAAQAVTGAVNRIEAMTREIEETTQTVVAASVAPSVSPAMPTVRVNQQTVQQTLNRGPRIIKAR